jgi:hypothetical protein
MGKTEYDNERSIGDKPLAVAGLTSFRYNGRYGWIMIAATDRQDALLEAQRSISPDSEAIMSRLQIWNGSEYEDA